VHFATSVRNTVGQSERSEGPYLIENGQIEEWRDLRIYVEASRPVLPGSMAAWNL